MDWATASRWVPRPWSPRPRPVVEPWDARVRRMGGREVLRLDASSSATKGSLSSEDRHAAGRCLLLQPTPTAPGTRSARGDRRSATKSRALSVVSEHLMRFGSLECESVLGAVAAHFYGRSAGVHAAPTAGA